MKSSRSVANEGMWEYSPTNLMNPPVVLAEEGASNAAVTGLLLPVVLAEEGASNAAVTGLLLPVVLAEEGASNAAVTGLSVQF
jgi:hypothetical protein